MSRVTGQSYMRFQPDGKIKWNFHTDESKYENNAIEGPVAIGSNGVIYFGTFKTAGPNKYSTLYALTRTENQDGSILYIITCV